MHNYDKLYADFHQRLLGNFLETLKEQAPFNQEHLNEDDHDFFQAIQQLPELRGDALLQQGQMCFCKIVSTYSHLMPLVPRDLLWFFGGDCLHYMPDEEIAKFQLLEDMRYEQATNEAYETLRARALGLH